MFIYSKIGFAGFYVLLKLYKWLSLSLYVYLYILGLHED